MNIFEGFIKAISFFFHINVMINLINIMIYELLYIFFINMDVRINAYLD